MSAEGIIPVIAPKDTAEAIKIMESHLCLRDGHRFKPTVGEVAGAWVHIVQQLGATEGLLAAVKEVLRITDRKHDAWDRAKEAIAKVEGGVE